MCAVQKQKFEIESDLKKNPADPRYTFDTPKKAKSDVWKNFCVIKFNGKVQKYAQCLKCKDILSYSGICGTGSLLRHKCDKRKSIKTEQKIEMPNKLIPEHIKNVFIKAQIKFITTDLRSPSIIEGEGFKQLAQTLIQIGDTYGNRNIEDILLTNQALTETYILAEYNKLKNNLENILQYNHLALAMDIWTDKHKQRSFLTLTTHYIDENFELKTYILGTREFLRDTQTSITIYVLVQEILKDFAVEHKLVSSFIVTSNESSIVDAFENFKRLSCACHNLNLVMSDVLENNNIPELELLNKASIKLVDYFKQADLNSQLTNSLKEIDRPGWSSIFNMLSSIYDMQQEIHKLLFDRNELHNISSVNLNLLQKVVEFLIPFQSCSLRLSSDEIPTIHEYFLWYQKLINHCKTNSSDSELIFELKMNTTKALNNRFKPCKIHNLGLFLNPPYKRLQFLDETQREYIINTVKIMLEDAIKEKEDQLLDNPADNGIKKLEHNEGNDIKNFERIEYFDIIKVEHNDDEDIQNFEHIGDDDIQNFEHNDDDDFKKFEHNDDVDIKKFEHNDDYDNCLPSTSKKLRCDSFDEFKDPVDNDRTQSSKSIEREINCYLKLVVDKDYSDILTFWKEATDLPLLRGLARQILNIPASCVTSEKVFSASDRVLEVKRTKLLEENFDMLLFLNKNFK